MVSKVRRDRIYPISEPVEVDIPDTVNVNIESQSVTIATTTTATPALIRWGIDQEPIWVRGVAVIAPGAGAVLITRAVGAGMVGHIYGFFISTQEANNFLMNWTSGGAAYSNRIVFGGLGTTQCVSPISLNGDLPADAGTNITITNVTAGAAGMIYQCHILYMEV